MLVGVPAERVARTEETVTGVHCLDADAYVDRMWVEFRFNV